MKIDKHLLGVVLSLILVSVTQTISMQLVLYELETLSPCGQYKATVTFENDCVRVWDLLSGKCLAELQDVLPGICRIQCSRNSSDSGVFFIIVNDYETVLEFDNWIRVVVLKFDKSSFKLSIVAEIKCIPSQEKIERLDIFGGNFLECETESGKLYRISIFSPQTFLIFDAHTGKPLRFRNAENMPF